MKTEIKMCWMTYRYERHLVNLLRGALKNNYGYIFHINTTASHSEKDICNQSKDKIPIENGKLSGLSHETKSNPQSENAKLDVFVRNIQFGRKRSRTLKNAEKVRQKGIIREASLSYTAQRTSTKPSIARLAITTRESEKLDFTHVRWQETNIDRKTVRDKPENINVVSSNVSIRCLNNNTSNEQRNKHVDLDSSIIPKITKQFYNGEYVSPSKVDSLNKHVPIKMTTNILTSYEKQGSVTLSKQIVPSKSYFSKKLTKAEQSSLLQLLDNGKLFKAFELVEIYIRENRLVPFGILRRLCGCACTLGEVGIVLKTKAIAKKSHRLFYDKEMSLDNYLASALCHSGDYEGSLSKLLELFRRSPNKGTKKTKDTAKLIIFHIMKRENKETEEMALKFVMQLADEENVLSPALSMWQICFSSNVYGHQKIAEMLLEKHPCLVEMFSLKLDNIIRNAYENGNLDLLHRIFQLLLLHNLSDYYSPATTSLLQHQCEIGDLNGAKETIKFAMALKILLKASLIQRYLAVLHQHRRPVPLYILELKYRLPPKPVLSPPPKFTYKF